ncbi:MAG: hypothetical protein QXG86_00345 [Candidatus Woesearchaeota archaeon]
MGKASITWDEIAKWVIILLLIIALIVIITILSGNASDLWNKLASILQIGG